MKTQVSEQSKREAEKKIASELCRIAKKIEKMRLSKTEIAQLLFDEKLNDDDMDEPLSNLFSILHDATWQ